MLSIFITHLIQPNELTGYILVTNRRVKYCNIFNILHCIKMFELRVFMVHIFSDSDWMRSFTKQISLLSANKKKHRENSEFRHLSGSRMSLSSLWEPHQWSTMEPVSVFSNFFSVTWQLMSWSYFESPLHKINLMSLTIYTRNMHHINYKN